VSYKRCVDWSIALVIGVAIGAVAAGPAHAAPRNAEQIELPTHKAWGQFHDTLDVVEDKERGIACYVVRQSDSHATALQCVKVKEI
jgi:hypothetical protein